MPEQTPSVTSYRNGNSTLLPSRRVFESAGLLRYATDSELENGTATTLIQPNYLGAVTVLEHGKQYRMVAAGPISDDAVVYRANDGKVSASGTSVIGRSRSVASADNDIIEVAFSVEATGGVGGPSSLRSLITKTAHGITAADIGKPISIVADGTVGIWNNLLAAQIPLGVLRSVVDVNVLELSLAGDVLTIPASLLPGDIDTKLSSENNRVLFWDNATSKYVYDNISGSAVNTDVILVVGKVGVNYEVQIRVPQRPVGSVVGLPGGGSRKDGIHALGNVSGAVTIDFSTGSYDNKSLTLNGNVTSWTFQNLVGEASLFITIDGTNRTVANMPAAADGGPGPIINQSANSKSIVKLTINGSDIFYG